VRLFVSLLFLGTACAQDRPEFVWQGRVDGIAILRLHGNRLDVQIKEGAPVDGQEFHFYHALPQTRQDARLRVIEGRGYVHVLEQPRVDNDFTLTVSIEDRQPGSALYSLALSWNTSGGMFERTRGQGRTETIVWSGRVDEEAVVSCQGNSCTSSTSRGSPVAAEHFKFSRPLPNQPVEVTLAAQNGRGDVRLVEQPSERNHYTARVSIRDPQAGSSEYSFKLEWNRPNAKEPVVVPVGRGLIWTGSVSGRARITVRGGAAISEALEGGRVEGGRGDFAVPLPASSDLHPAVKILRGRGRAAIVELPSEQNNYQLVFEIADPGPGADAYEIEVDW
jgi:hypothetical protein